MTTARWLTGDVFERLADVEDGSVDLAAFSPPFWKQRAYLDDDHPAKPWEIGQEDTPAQFVDVLLRLTAALRPKLSPHASIAVELADTASGSGGAGGDYNPGGLKAGQPRYAGSAAAGKGKTDRVRQAAHPIPNLNAKRQPTVKDGPLLKSLCMIPEAYRLALAWGFNPLTGQPSPAGKWIVRNVVDWCRPNPTPGDDGDKFRRASSDIVIATLSPRRWWDGEAVRVPATGDSYARATNGRKAGAGDRDEVRAAGITTRESDGTRPLYDWWEITPKQYPGAHYAVWTPEIARRLILSMCPARVCRTCGEPSRRILDRDPSPLPSEPGQPNKVNRLVGRVGKKDANLTRSARTVGWTDCGHDDWRPGHVLDPFGGSGTTGAVATGNGRAATLIDLNPDNVNLALDRIGMFLEVAG